MACVNIDRIQLAYKTVMYQTQSTISWAHIPHDRISYVNKDRVQIAYKKVMYQETKNCFIGTVYPKKYAHGFCFAVLCCGYTLTDFPISIRLTSLALW